MNKSLLHKLTKLSQAQLIAREINHIFSDNVSNCRCRCHYDGKVVLKNISLTLLILLCCSCQHKQPSESPIVEEAQEVSSCIEIELGKNLKDSGEKTLLSNLVEDVEFVKDDAYNAIYSIMDVIKWLKMTETSLFGVMSKCNTVYSLLHMFQALLLYPCFMIRNPYHFGDSSLSHLLHYKKDVFYKFMSNPKIDWRKLVYYLYLQLWSKVKVRSEHKEGLTYLIVDDTDYPKTGRCIENIGRVKLAS